MTFAVALIPARGGSKGLPGKNIRPLGGKPLIAWTVEAALESALFARVVVSTDDETIAEAALAAGAEVPFMRPPHLATDSASSFEVAAHALGALSVDGPFALLQPTSPFRTARHIREAADLFARHRPAAVIGAAVSKPLAWTYRIAADGSMVPVVASKAATRRQDEQTAVQPNGSLYMMHSANLAAATGFIPPGTMPFVMDRIASIDIDDLDDFRLAEAVLAGGLVHGAP
jgi:CMP-N,N'-diacetyllegionaminic acid synthase